MILPSYKAAIYASMPAAVAAEKSSVYLFRIFWDTEVILNRFDTVSTTTETTARGWFFR
jgi:hypothetical protein